ncbi:hypothetical protein FLONG3_6427 [Fusarium longipes]|uniref:Uncharacterized protein n=1 Tax=Fusarium longipes TaxID=694270 RepID=A0A395SL05_9HYPO|nr:hypothetical protein FLONG3_6427 [Fusarium longipes]
MQLETGTTTKTRVSQGTMGYLVSREGDQSLVQLIKSTGQRGACRVPHEALEIGVPHSQFQIRLPHLVSAQYFPLSKETGCNWSLLLQEVMFRRREWMRYHVNTLDERPMLVISIELMEDGKPHCDSQPAKGHSVATGPTQSKVSEPRISTAHSPPKV